MEDAAAKPVVQWITWTLGSKGIRPAPPCSVPPWLQPPLSRCQSLTAGVMQSTCAAGQGGFAQQQMHGAWQAYLDFEMTNPQRLEAAALAARVLHAYEQALMVLLHYPEVGQPAAGLVVLNLCSTGCLCLCLGCLPGRAPEAAGGPILQPGRISCLLHTAPAASAFHVGVLATCSQLFCCPGCCCLP